jgi:hypothetical protein
LLVVSPEGNSIYLPAWAAVEVGKWLLENAYPPPDTRAEAIQKQAMAGSINSAYKPPVSTE